MLPHHPSNDSPASPNRPTPKSGADLRSPRPSVLKPWRFSVLFLGGLAAVSLALEPGYLPEEDGYRYATAGIMAGLYGLIAAAAGWFAYRLFARSPVAGHAAFCLCTLIAAAATVAVSTPGATALTAAGIDVASVNAKIRSQIASDDAATGMAKSGDLPKVRVYRKNPPQAAAGDR
jgi:hypothetical protein